MKKIFSLLTAPLILAGLLFSCKPEQSELNLDALPGTATVTGIVEYNPGVTKVGNAYIRDYKLPAAGRTVCVKVYTENYLNADKEGQGSYRSFTAQTDDKGHYSVSVPVGYSAIRPEVTVLPFVGEKTDLDVNDQIITLENAVFETEAQTPTLEDQFIAECNFVMASDKEAEVEYNQKVTLKGLVETAAESKSDDEVVKVYNGYACALIVRVSINGEETMKYNATASNDGRYSLDMMLPNNCWNKNVTVSVTKEASVAEFTHYYYQDDKWKAQTIEAIYEGSQQMQLSSTHKIVPMEMETMEIVPRPVNRDEVKGIGNDIDEELEIEETNNPLGW
ncbi:MAG: hypothetical protein K2L03_05460 [Bacteroidales bacterium]|nr:hypothetical protein [Bacteroidales bacterium]